VTEPGLQADSPLTYCADLRAARVVRADEQHLGHIGHDSSFLASQMGRLLDTGTR
jgi:hypothetical protein